jgi:hypothetical protein
MPALRLLGFRAHAALLSSVLLLACGGRSVSPDESEPTLDAVAEQTAGSATREPERLHAVLLNGGGRPRINYYSHLDHLRSLIALLEAAGVEREHIHVFSSDGEDPAEDLATREGVLPADFWLLPRRVARWLRPPIVYVNSEIEGFELRPATHQALRSWFEDAGSRLASGDALLLYVTDHGEKGEDDVEDNTISLWEEKLSVREFRGLLALLDPGVRVVMLMSQCYSGAFANAIFVGEDARLTHGNVCGYFSATADRKATGCYPEVSGKQAVGHSYRIFAALASGFDLAGAQRQVLVSDRSPDVPHATSSLLLKRHLEQAAARAGLEPAAFVDGLLDEALADPLAWEQEIRLLDRVGRSFGLASPRSLAELDDQARDLSELSKALETYADRWQRAFEALRSENFEAFRKAQPAWDARLAPEARRASGADARDWETAELLGALAGFTEQTAERAARLRDLRGKAGEARSARYRAEVRLAVVLRMRGVLTDLAGRYSLARQAGDEERQAFARLEACEHLALGPGGAVAPDAEPPPLPTLAEERQRLAAIAPGWLGIRYRPPRARERTRHGLPPGAVVVQAVLPDSPAAAAGLEVSDVVLGPPGEPFAEPHGLREWVMQGELGTPLALRLLRDGRELDATLRLTTHPLELPELPGAERSP